MELKERKLNYIDTINKIFEFSQKYKDDLIHHQNCSLWDFYEKVKNLEYKPDPLQSEFLARPKYSISELAVYRDCDDKTLIMTSFFELKNLNYGIVTTGQNKKPSHILPILILNKTLIPYDATYPTNKIGFLPPQHKIIDIFKKK